MNLEDKVNDRPKPNDPDTDDEPLDPEQPPDPPDNQPGGDIYIDP